MPDCEGFDTLETVIEQYQVLETINEKYSYPAYVLLGLKATTLLIGLSIVFIWKQKDAKLKFKKTVKYQKQSRRYELDQLSKKYKKNS